MGSSASKSTRENLSTKSVGYLNDVYASGTYKDVYLGVYTAGARRGERCVCKLFKSGSVYSAACFASEIKVITKAIEIIEAINRNPFAPCKVLVNRATVWEFTHKQPPGEMLLVEPFIDGFQKFNSNSGWAAPSDPLDTRSWNSFMQALSHYSYHVTGGSALLCDLQGSTSSKDGVILTDPVIMSTTQKYGPTDLGPKGISTFFARHRCNKYCRQTWLLPTVVAPFFDMKQGTSMELTQSTATGMTQRTTKRK